MTDISGQFRISGQFQDNFTISGISRPLKSLKLELGGAAWGPKSRISTEYLRCKAESGDRILDEVAASSSPPAMDLGESWKLPSGLRGGTPAANAFSGIKSPEMHVADINFINFTAQICTHNQSWMGRYLEGAVAPNRRPLATPPTTVSLTTCTHTLHCAILTLPFNLRTDNWHTSYPCLRTPSERFWFILHPLRFQQTDKQMGKTHTRKVT